MNGDKRPTMLSFLKILYEKGSVRIKNNKKRGKEKYSKFFLNNPINSVVIASPKTHIST